ATAPPPQRGSRREAAPSRTRRASAWRGGRPSVGRRDASSDTVERPDPYSLGTFEAGGGQGVDRPPARLGRGGRVALDRRTGLAIRGDAGIPVRSRTIERLEAVGGFDPRHLLAKRPDRLGRRTRGPLRGLLLDQGERSERLGSRVLERLGERRL